MSALFCFPCREERWLPLLGLPAPLKFLVPLGLRNKLNSLTNPMAKALLIICRSTAHRILTNCHIFWQQKLLSSPFAKWIVLLLQTEVLVDGIYLIINFRGYFFSHFESMSDQANRFPCYRADWSSFPPTRSVSLGRCEEARNREKFDVCWRSQQDWSKLPFTTNLCFFGRFLLINIILIPKLDASIQGLMSIDTQNSRKQICFP